MKKFFLLLSMVLSVTVLVAQTPSNPNPSGPRPVPLIIKTPHQGGTLKPLPKSPVQIPEVYLEDSVLYFDAAIEGCTVQLLDEDENVVFSDSIEENQTTLTFPSTLTGEFELQIIQDDIIFYCIIEL